MTIRIPSRYIRTLALLLACSVGATANAQDGQLDATFGNGGVVLAALGNASFFKKEAARSIVELPDGGILTTGDYDRADGVGSRRRWCLVKYTAAGILDDSFGINGVVRVVFGPGADNVFSAKALYDPSTSRILLCGMGRPDGTGPLGLCVMRFLLDGTVDIAFGNNGLAYTSVAGASVSSATDMVLQADGGIVVSGVFTGPGYEPLLVRFTSAGTLDTTFGSGGFFNSGGSGLDGNAQALAIDEEGNLYLGVNGTSVLLSTAGKILLYKLDGNGAQLSDWNGSGLLQFDPSTATDELTDLQLMPDGRVVTAAFVNGNVLVSRFLQNAVLDTTFSTDGNAAFDVTEQQDRMNSLTVQPDCRILLGGTTGYTSVISADHPLPTLMRLESNGVLDLSFGDNGVIRDSVPTATDGEGVLLHATLHSDGRILSCGAGYGVNGDANNDDQFLMVRTASLDDCPPPLHVGVSDAIQPNGLRLSPVPCADELSVAGLRQGAQYTVLDAGGRVVRSSQVNDQGERAVIGLHGLGGGSYVLVVHDQSEVMRSAFIKL